MRDEITITQEEFINLCGLAFIGLRRAGKITMEDQEQYSDICAALTYMFTDEYQEMKKHES